MMNLDWIDTLVIAEEFSGNKKNEPTTIRETSLHFKPGYSYQSTTLTRDAAECVINELKKYKDAKNGQ